MTDTRTPVDPELFARTAPAFNCITSPEGPHYRAGDGSCRWCGLTAAQIAADGRTHAPDYRAEVSQLGTEHNGYAVRAVVAGEVAEGHLPHWYVAAEGPEGWAAWTVVLEYSRLLWTCPSVYAMPSGDPLDRAGALAELAERAGLGNAPPF